MPGKPQSRPAPLRDFMHHHYPRARLRRLTRPERTQVERCLDRLPYYRPHVRFLAGESLAHRNRRLVAAPEDSRALNAASFVPHRLIVLDRDLLARRRDLARILYHEIFHFLWARLGAPLRRQYEDLLRREWREGARGELGWPSERLKLAVARDDFAHRSQRWREYACESFCDSAAWFCLGGYPAHAEWTLKRRFCDRRRRWFLGADILPRLHLKHS